ncbi:hypothetical protein [Legionella fallonii]|uniref:Uncharacterized protein n=1 Tax=Legionella fallonii LLAP-10 TaxID=1212491 RepID=A0A098G9Y7_9GAMM|nr:hypothetical protein [Legionella fallonii]CEG59294.1 protein of unknown function [Legionella fallonii LLAP-10]
MHTFNLELKNGKRLVIPAEYYPRYADIVATKENSFCLTPISRFEAFLKTVGHCIFNPIFAVLSIINLSLCAPLLIRDVGKQEAIYYSYLFIGFIISYYSTKCYLGLMRKDPMSIEGVAEKLGYKSSSSPLKPYDERMFKAIITINRLKIPRKDYFFDDLYGIIFDAATSRRLADIFGPSNLRLVK